MIPSFHLSRKGQTERNTILRHIKSSRRKNKCEKIRKIKRNCARVIVTRAKGVQRSEDVQYYRRPLSQCSSYSVDEPTMSRQYYRECYVLLSTVRCQRLARERCPCVDCYHQILRKKISFLYDTSQSYAMCVIEKGKERKVPLRMQHSRSYYWAVGINHRYRDFVQHIR